MVELVTRYQVVVIGRRKPEQLWEQWVILGDYGTLEEARAHEKHADWHDARNGVRNEINMILTYWEWNAS